MCNFTSKYSPATHFRKQRLTTSKLWVVLLGSLFLFPTLGYAHGVTEGDASFLESSQGIQLLPFIYLGAKHMVGIDIDPQAVLATDENAQRNNIDANRIEIYLPEDAPQSQVEIVLANILAGPLVELKEAILSHLLPNGLLVLSGILASQAQTVADAYAQHCDILSIDEDDGWVRICAQKHV